MGVGGEVGSGRRGWGGIAERGSLGQSGRARRVGVTQQADGGRSSHFNHAPGRLLWRQLHQNYLGCLCRMPVTGPHPAPTESAVPGTGIRILRSPPPP